MTLMVLSGTSAEPSRSIIMKSWDEHLELLGRLEPSTTQSFPYQFLKTVGPRANSIDVVGYSIGKVGVAKCI